MRILTPSTAERYGRYPLSLFQRHALRLALGILRGVIDVLEKHEYYGPEWAKTANAVAQDIEDYCEDEEEHHPAEREEEQIRAGKIVPMGLGTMPAGSKWEGK